MKLYLIKFPCPTRGFFGIYLEAIRCIDFAVTNDLPFYVDLSESNSLYTDALQFDGNKNIWDYYFLQSKPQADTIIYSTMKYEGCTDKIWTHAHFRRVHKRAVQHLNYTPALQALLHERKQTFPASTIGVHIRKTDHTTEVPAIAFEKYIYCLHNAINKYHYKNIFLATDDTSVVEAITKAFPSANVICNTVNRSADGQPVHKSKVFENKFSLGAEAILDAYSLSLCDKVILSNSNLSYCAMYMNPSLKFQLLDGFQASGVQMFFTNWLRTMRYAVFHQQVFIHWHRKWRYFISRLKPDTSVKTAT